MKPRVSLAVLATLLGSTMLPLILSAQRGAPQSEWRYFGGDKAFTR
jgi:hypothetical protein